MPKKSAMQQGWDFSAKLVGSNVAVQAGIGYVAEVEKAIDVLVADMAKLKSGQSDAVLGGYAAEFWHADTFNIHAVAAGSGSRAWVDEAARINYGSVDIDTNFGKTYSLKYMSTAEHSAVEQSHYSAELGQPKYLGQERLVPTDQIVDAQKIATRRATTNSTIRPEVAEGYQDTASHLVDTVSDGKVESSPLGKDEDLKIAREIKRDDFSAEKHGESLQTIIKPEYIIREAAKAGITTAAITVALQLAPEIYKAIDYLIKNKKIDPQHLKQMGLKALSAGAEGFLRGAISCSVLIMCKQGLLGETLKTVSPSLLGTVVAIALETVKNSLLVATGKMTPKAMGAAFADSLFIAGGFLLGAKVGGAIGQALCFQLPVIGYLIGSLIGSACAVVYNVVKNKLISFCIDSGFTCFGLVEQDYQLPEEYLASMGINLTPISRTEVKRTEVKRTEVGTAAVKQTTYETIDIKFLRRGIIGVNKVGYVFT